MAKTVSRSTGSWMSRLKLWRLSLPLATPPLYTPAQAAEDPEHRNFRRLTFTFAIIALASRLSRLDGNASPHMFSVFRDVFDLPSEEAEPFRPLFALAKDETAPVAHYTRQIRQLFPQRRKLHEEVLARLFRFAAADGPLSAKEREFLAQIAGELQVRRAVYQKLLKQYHVVRQDSPYAVLGLSAQAKDADIRLQYRRLIREYHPDGLAAYGYTPEQIADCERKLSAINEAYTAICQKRGMKR